MDFVTTLFFQFFSQIGNSYLQTNGGLDTVGIVYLILSRCSCACHQLTIQATVCGHARKVDSSVGYQFRRLQQVILTGQSVVMSYLYVYGILNKFMSYRYVCPKKSPG